MSAGYRVFDKDIDVSYLDAVLLDDKGCLKAIDASQYQQYPNDHLALWCHHKGIYGLPTTELIAWIKGHIVEGKTIEIGAGNGALGRILGIPITDSCCMEILEVATYYALNGQPVTKYPEDIVRLDALSAVKKYKAEVVLGSWITHKYREEEHWRGGNMYGIDEDAILDCKHVKKYIVVGNTNVHGKKRVLDRTDFKIYIYSFPWIVSRSISPDKNVIYLWERK